MHYRKSCKITVAFSFWNCKNRNIQTSQLKIEKSRIWTNVLIWFFISFQNKSAKNKLSFSFNRNYQYGNESGHKNVKDLLRMDSDDSDSELDIETSTTPDNVSVSGDGGSESGRKENPSLSSLGSLGIKPENTENSIISGIGGSGSPSSISAATTINSTSFAPRMAAVQNNSAAAAAAAAAGLAAASVNPDYATLAAKNWLKAQDPTQNHGLHSFFMPFSAAAAAAAAAAHHAHLPFPHHFNSQGSLFHVKDSVWL